MTEAYSIEIFVPSGDPEGLRIIRQKAWSVECLTFPRSAWSEAKERRELNKTGLYILTGYHEDDDAMPVLYIGQTDNLRKRLEQHRIKKEFWDNAVVFTSSNDFLNTAYVGWLERHFHDRAVAMERCRLDNDSNPPRPSLSEPEIATLETFARQALQILPLVGVTAFKEKRVFRPGQASDKVNGKSWRHDRSQWDTVVVPAKKEGFEEVFLGENCWRAIRIGGGMLDQLKYIAAYQVSPVMAITHLAEIDRIEAYGDTGKYQLFFKTPASEIKPIPYGDAPSGAMQGPRYTNIDHLMQATSVKDVLFSET